MSISAFQPLLPRLHKIEPLTEMASELVDVGLRLGTQAGPLADSLRPLLRSMNSYYTNRIEGQHTQPVEIERALRREFDADVAQARKQRIAIAHIEAEEELEGQPAGPLYTAAKVSAVHAALYRRLEARDRMSDTGTEIVPGAFRDVLVTAGNHLAPEAHLIAGLLAAWGEGYGQLKGREQALVGAMCSHHRLLWIHPFLDGNGRTARLHTHLVLQKSGLTHGLWSPLRGIARDVDTYYARLNNADLPRRNDLDGRGSLSEEELVRFAKWLLGVCIDQARFMGTMLSLDEFRARIAELLRFLEATPWRMGSELSVVRVEALHALHYLAITGPLERAHFMTMTGLPPRTARRVLASLLNFGVLTATTPRSPVTFAFPLASLRFLLPRLWPEAEADVAQ
jgi:Fic family protein